MVCKRIPYLTIAIRQGMKTSTSGVCSRRYKLVISPQIIARILRCEELKNSSGTSLIYKNSNIINSPIKESGMIYALQQVIICTNMTSL